jgi:hypothetical protein
VADEEVKMDERGWWFRSLLTAAMALWVGSAAVAAPVVIDFEALRRNDNDIPTHGTSYVEDGFLLRIATTGAGWATIGVQHPAFNGSTAIFPNTWRSDAILTKVNGGAFDIQSVDLIEHFEGIRPTVTFSGITRGGSPVSTTFRLDGNTELFETFRFPETFRDLTQVTWSHFDPENSFRLDNITLDGAPPPAVPLPPAVIAGVGAIPLLVRARRRLGAR